MIAPAGRQYLFQATSEKDLNSWLAFINFAASFKTGNIRMRSINNGAPSPGTQSPSVSGRTLRGSIETTDSTSTRDDSLPLPLSPVSEEGEASPMSRSLRGLALNGLVAGPSSPRSSDVFGKFEGSSNRLPLSRADNLRVCSWFLLLRRLGLIDLFVFTQTKIQELETKIRTEKARLDGDLRFVRNLAVLTPCSRPTRDRIVAAATSVEKRVRHSRMK